MDRSIRNHSSTTTTTHSICCLYYIYSYDYGLRRDQQLQDQHRQQQERIVPSVRGDRQHWGYSLKKQETTVIEITRDASADEAQLLVVCFEVSVER
jgi:hypothetical protein